MDPMTAAMCAVVLPTLGLVEPPPSPPAPPVPPGKAAAPGPALPVPYPHPLITEVLYAVPNSDDADPSQDGSRHVSGDEFIELVNPHDQPIQLLGYTLTDRNPAGKGQLKFTFPAFELAPNAVVVVFNGFEQTWSGVGPVGDAKKAPEGPNESFAGAYVFTARAANSKTSFANAGDFVLLADPSSQPVHCVSWGSFKEKIPAALLVETAPVTNKASVQRDSITGGFSVHPPSDAEPKQAFSPGKFGEEKKSAPEVQSGSPTPANDRK